MIIAFHHVQVTMPPGREDEARQFYGGVLRMTERPKPDHLAKRGGVWFFSGSAEVHLGVEEGFRPALKAHPALLVSDLTGLKERCERAGFAVNTDPPLPGYAEGHDRAYVTDPFGNRLEFLEPTELPGV
ncbi:MAG TPA: VOC family protein [Thermoanaerobaculia bacterium]|nr:VOC family protein [Thermoanaerobaculia bacterium]